MSAARHLAQRGPEGHRTAISVEQSESVTAGRVFELFGARFNLLGGGRRSGEHRELELALLSLSTPFLLKIAHAKAVK